MQAIFFITLFSLFLSIGTSIVIGSGSSSTQITQARIDETQAFFNSLQASINQITRDNLQATTAAQVTDPANFIKTNENLAQLASGRWTDPTLDPWGKAIQVLAARENRVLYSNGADQVIAPVTGFALISSGPDQVLQTAIPTNPTIASLQGILPPVGSDDIVSVFTDEPAQRQNWTYRQKHLQNIANAMMRHYQFQTKNYVDNYSANYLTQLQTRGVTTTPDITTLMLTDPNAPTYPDVNDISSRASLGVEEDFQALERVLPSGGSFRVESTTNPDNSVTLRLTNGPTRTPWGGTTGNLNYTINLKGAV